MNPFLRTILAILETDPLVSNVRIVLLDETPAGRLEVKIRCRIAHQQQFQVWIHQGPAVLDYAYQLFTTVPLLRWDNAPHYPKIATAPHHYHDERNNVGSSRLTGEPTADLPLVLAAIAQWLDRQGLEA
jgi:hypothetical protein